MYSTIQTPKTVRICLLCDFSYLILQATYMQSESLDKCDSDTNFIWPPHDVDRLSYRSELEKVVTHKFQIILIRVDGKAHTDSTTA